MAEEKRPLIEVKNLKKYFQVGSGKTLHAVDRHWGLLERADVEKVPLVP